ncbi:MAG TPA: DEAD/DEAH box helicase [Cytophagaceae bacterium]|jgi:hypothetical protein
MSTNTTQFDPENEEYSKALSIIEDTNQSLFLSGKAGTGKSTFLKEICKSTKKKFVLVAPTGIAAINAGGMTINSFFKLPFRFFLPTDSDFHTGNIQDFLRYDDDKRKLFNELELVVIDEISMVRADVLDAIDKIMRFYCGNSFEAFAGKQMLLIGDLYQLEPVVTKEELPLLSKFYDSPYFFSSFAFKESNFAHVEFKKIYRQKDEGFIELLNKVRVNKADILDLYKINQRCRPCKLEGETSTAITLATLRKTADSINQLELHKLKTKELIFKGVIEGDFNSNNLPTDLELKLKEGAQVMFVKNDTKRRWVNGTIGKIVEITENQIKVQFESEEVIDVDKMVWENISYTYDDKLNKIVEKQLGSFTQYPLRLAWAVTIHKSQGLTFKHVIVDLGYGSFAAGQLYVALSRCTSLEGLYLRTPVKRSDLIVSNSVVEFLESI